MAIEVEEAGITGSQPAIPERLGGSLQVLIVSRKDTRSFDKHLPLFTDFEIDARNGGPYCIQLDIAVGL